MAKNKKTNRNIAINLALFFVAIAIFLVFFEIKAKILYLFSGKRASKKEDSQKRKIIYK